MGQLEKRSKDLLKEMLSTRRIKVNDKDQTTVARRMVRGKRQKHMANGHINLGGDAISNNNLNQNMDEQL